jgi:IS30 family transposase
MNQREKKKRNEVSQKELLAAVTALEEIVMAEMPKEWEEEEVAEVKDKIRRKLLANGKELTRSSLYRAVHGDRTGLATFNRALRSLKDNREIAIVKKDTSRGRPVGKIKLLRVIGDKAN